MKSPVLRVDKTTELFFLFWLKKPVSRVTLDTAAAASRRLFNFFLIIVLAANALSPAFALAAPAPENIGQPTVDLRQNLSWGVLAMNAEKAAYQAGQQVNLAMAVLDQEGNMDCSANLQLLVQRQGESRAALLTTANGGIKVNPECRQKKYVTKPDFEASFAFAKSGDYRLTLTAATIRGTRSISQTFNVGSAAPFEIQRQAPTRLYPAADYPVRITVTANRDFSGVVEEKLPASFEVVGQPRAALPLADELQKIINFSGARSAATPSASVYSTQDNKVIAFPVSLKAGESVMLSYTFHAPPTSPEFYELGPLSFVAQGLALPSRQAAGLRYIEPRVWQLANDAIAFRATSTAVAAASGNITMTVPAGTVANDIMVAVITSDDNVSLSFPANSGWTKEIELNNGAAQRTTVAWKRATTTETGLTYVVTHTSGNSIISTVSSFSGAFTSGNPFEATSTSLVGDLGKDFTVTTTPITTQTAGDMIILAYGWGNDETMNNASYACNDPAALTEAFDNLTSLGSDSSAMMAYGLQSNAGSTGICNATSKQNSTGADTSISMALALKPAPTLITVSGNLYSNEGTTAIDCSASSTTVVLKVNGTTGYTGSCTLNTGAYSIANVSVSSDDIITAYIGSATVKGAVVTRATTVNITNLNIYQNELIARSDTTNAVTNANLGNYDKDNDSTSLFFTSNSNNLSLDSNFNLFVWPSDTYAPGGTVTTQGTGDLHASTTATITLDTAGNSIAGNLEVNNGATVNINADTTIGKGISVAGTGIVTYSGTPTVTFSGTGTLITTSTTISLYNFLTSGSGTLTISASTSVAGTFTTAGTGTVTDNASTTIVGALSVGSGTTLNGTGNIISAGGASGAGTVNMTGGNVELQGTNNLSNTGAWTFNNLNIGNGAAASITALNAATVTVSSVLNVASSRTLNAGVKTFVLSGSGTPFVVNGTFTASSSTVSFQGTTGTTTVPNLTYYNLDFSPNAGTPVFQFANNTFFTATDTPESDIGSLAVDSTNGAIYAGSGAGGIIYKCLTSTDCVSAGNWTTATDTPESYIYSLAVYSSSTNPSLDAIYAGSGSSGIIYKCLTSTGCVSAGNWTTATDTPENYINSLAVDSTNGAIYAGSNSSGIIYKCVLSTGCTSAGNWTIATDTPSYIYSLAVDSTNGAIYAGSYSSGIIYKCLTSTGCTSAGNWTIATDTPESYIYSLAVDSANGAIYAGTNPSGFIYKSSTNFNLTVNNNLSLNGIGNETLDAKSYNVSVTVGGTLTVGSGDTYSASASTTIANLTNSGTYTAGATTTISGSFTNNGTFTHNNGTVLLNATTPGKTVQAGGSPFYNLTFNGTGGWTLTDNSTTTNVLTLVVGTLVASGTTITLTGTGTPFVVNGTFLPQNSQVSFQGTTGTITVATTTYNNLDFSPASGSPEYRTAAGTLTVNNNVTLNGVGTELVNAAANSTALNLTNLTIGSGDTFSAPSSSSFTLSGNLTNNGTFTHNTGL